MSPVKIKYIGLSNERIIRDSDFKNNEIKNETLTFNEENNFSIKVPEEVAKFLLTLDGEFIKIQNLKDYNKENKISEKSDSLSEQSTASKEESATPEDENS